jgi:4-hydroxybenzoate polyprenyltransferase
MKKIPVIKNIACAVLVAFSVIFSGLSSSGPFFENPNRRLLYITANAIFGGSWTNEILLDIRDEAGDKANGIWTLATLYGKQSAWTTAHMVLYVNVWMNTVGLVGLGMNPFLYIGIMSTQFYMLYKIPDKMFSKSSIQSYLNHTTKMMFLLLLYLSYKETY